MGIIVPRGICDTSVLISSSVGIIPGTLAISVISLAELEFGVLKASDPEARADRLARLNRIRRRFDALPVDEAVSKSYARLAARTAQLGRRPQSRSLDLLIAATAHAHSATLFTANAADVAGFNDLINIIQVSVS
jgi:toxin FitB